MEVQSTTVWRLSDTQIEELRTAFRCSIPFWKNGIVIHKIGFDDKGGLLLELEDRGYLETIRIGKEEPEGKVASFICKKKNTF